MKATHWSYVYMYKAPVLDTPAGTGGAGAEAVVARPSGISTSINRLGSSIMNGYGYKSTIFYIIMIITGHNKKIKYWINLLISQPRYLMVCSLGTSSISMTIH